MYLHIHVPAWISSCREKEYNEQQVFMSSYLSYHCSENVPLLPGVFICLFLIGF